MTFHPTQEQDFGKKPPVMTMVSSGKGGVGKTWLSLTLAHALVQKKQKVLLFDGDLGLANVDIQLGLIPKKDLGGVLWGQSTLQETVLTYEKNFDILAGRSGCGSLAQIHEERYEKILADLLTLGQEKGYDHIILDLGAGVGKFLRYAARVADHSLVVLTHDPTSLTDAYAVIKVLHGLYPKLSHHIVVNQAESEDEGKRTFQTLQHVAHSFLHLSLSLAGIIHKDIRVQDSVRHQTLITQRFPQSQASKDVIALAGFLEKIPKLNQKKVS